MARALLGARLALRSASLGLLAACVGCAGTRASERPLPFHVALVPLAPRIVPAEHPDRRAREPELVLSLEAEQATAAVRERLQRDGFARVSTLSPPPELPTSDFAAWPVERRDAWWIAQAEREGADLLLEGELAFAREVRGGTNEKFWLNLLLFVLGGPGCYFVDDRSYAMEARLRASVHELHALSAERATLGDGRARLARVEARVEQASLDFLDRAGARPGPYALSLLVPAGLVATGGPAVERGLARRACESLGEELARELRREGGEILAATSVVPFHVVPQLELARAGCELEVRGEALLRRGAVERLDELVLDAGAGSVRVVLGPGALDERLSTARDPVLRVPFHARLPAASDAELLRLELVGGGRDALRRSFSFPLGSAQPPLATRSAEPPAGEQSTVHADESVERGSAGVRATHPAQGDRP